LFVSIRRFALNISAMSSANVIRLLAQFFAVPVLSRLLSPAEYGIVGMAMPIILFTMMIADAGLGLSLVRSSASDSNAWSTCFWLSLLLGAASGALIAGFAPVLAIIVGEPDLGPIVMALALIVVAQALTAVPGAALLRSERFKIIAASEIVPALGGIATAVFIAAHGGGAWALVGQQLMFFGLRLSMTLGFSSFRPKLVFEWSTAREHALFARDLLGTNIVGFLSTSADNVIIGMALGPASVGLYAMAIQFVRLPAMVITGPLQYVLYGRLAKIKHDVAAVRRVFLFITRALAVVIFPGVGLVAAAHQPVFDLLLSSKWAQSGEVFMIVGPVGALQAVVSLGGTVMVAMGRTDIQLRATAELGVLWVFTMLASVWFGITWVAIAYDCAILCYLPRSLQLVLKPIGCSGRAYFATLVVQFVTTVVGFVLFAEIKPFLAPIAQLAAAAMIAVLGIGISALLQRNVLMREVRLINLS
jgi:O-antigen/teichoic acid export membrane protein